MATPKTHAGPRKKGNVANLHETDEEELDLPEREMELTQIVNNLQDRHFDTTRDLHALAEAYDALEEALEEVVEHTDEEFVEDFLNHVLAEEGVDFDELNVAYE